MLHNLTALRPLLYLLTGLCVGFSLSAPNAQAQPSAAANNENTLWVRDKGLQMGLNQAELAYVVQVSGRNRLECLVAALAEFAQFLGQNTTFRHQDGSKLNREVTSRASHRLRGYDIERESTGVQHTETTLQEASPQSKDNATYAEEVITLINKDGALLCALYSKAEGHKRVVSFYPTLAATRRQELENQLMKEFVRDSHTSTTGANAEELRVFIINCAPRR